MNKNINRLLIPEGVRDLLPGPARRKREVEDRIQEVFGLWGYDEVSTPTFEYSDTFTGGVKSELEEKVYRFLDERGRTMALRPDFTFPLARVVATHLANEPKPLRLCYGGSVFRYASRQQGRQRELTQAGVELVGAGCAGSDAEAMALAVDVLLSLGLKEFTLCLGHVGFLQSLLAAHGVDATASEQIKGYFHKKDFVSLRELVSTLPLPDFSRDCILRIPSLRGGVEILSEAAALIHRATDGSLASLAEVLQVLNDYGVSRFVTLDLSLVSTMDYYTGMVFEGYTGGLGFPICGGGRYDRLLGHFGPELPAVGFALNIDHILTVLERQQRSGEAKLLFVAYCSGAGAAAVAGAQEFRAQGIPVIVDTAPRDIAEAEREGRRRKALKILYYNGTGRKDICLS